MYQFQLYSDFSSLMSDEVYRQYFDPCFDDDASVNMSSVCGIISFCVFEAIKTFIFKSSSEFIQSHAGTISRAHFIKYLTSKIY